MSPTAEAIRQDLSTLSQDQLSQVANFIAFLKFQGKYRRIELHPEQLAPLADEFAEEDKELAEAGMRDYATSLSREDKL